MYHANDISIFKYILLFALLGTCFIFFVPSKSIEKYTNYSTPPNSSGSDEATMNVSPLPKSKWSDDDWLLSDTPDISGNTTTHGAIDNSGTTITPDISGTTTTPVITKKLSHLEYDKNINQDNSLDFQGEYSIPILAPTPPVFSSTSLTLGGPADYAPSYNNTVNFSKLSGFSYNSPITDSNDVNGGFCSFDKKNPEKLEYKCNQLNKDTCASTACCVLLGGSKCVYGNKNGVYMKANYTDPSILNKDRYYYLGNCYGNCTNPQGSNQPLISTLRPTTTPSTVPGTVP